MTSSAAAPRGHTKLEKELLRALRRIADFSGHYENTSSKRMCALYPEYEGYRDAMDEPSDAIRLSLRDIARAAIKLATGAP